MSCFQLHFELYELHKLFDYQEKSVNIKSGFILVIEPFTRNAQLVVPIYIIVFVLFVIRSSGEFWKLAQETTSKNIFAKIPNSVLLLLKLGATES